MGPCWTAVMVVFVRAVLVAQLTVTVTGVVVDETGAVIPGAAVTLMDQNKPLSPAVVSEADGSFVFHGIPPGAYVLRVEASGFETHQASLVATEDVSVRVLLRVAAVEKVTVEADSTDVLSTAASDTATVRIDEEWLRDLPVAADNVLGLVGRFVAPAAQGAAGASIFVDGVAGDQLDLPSSAIGRIRVNRDPYSAVFQHPGKARVEVSTKRGHRSRYDGGIVVWDQNSIFSARNAFARSVPDLNRRLVQGTVGGPLPGRQSAFYVSAERFVNDASAVINAVTPAGPFVENVPTSQQRHTVFARGQWWPGSLQTVYATYGYSDQAFTNRDSGGFNLPERGFDADRHKHKLTVNYGAVRPPNWQNNLLFNFTDEDEQTGAAATAPAVIVTDAFAAGPAQTFTGDSRRIVEVENATRYFGRAGHSFVVGAKFRADATDVFDASNFGGTFEFASLPAFAAGAPLFFRVNRGDPHVAFDFHTASVYAQDEIRVTPRFTLTAGLRYDWQSTVHDTNNVAPRISFVVAPTEDKRTLIRGGAGVFYDALPRSVTERSLLIDGVRLREVVIPSPGFPDPFTGEQLVAPLPSAIRVAPDLQSPSLVQASAAIEHELWRRNWVIVEYAWLRSAHLFRARNVNAPLPQTGQRPDPAFLSITQVESTAFERGQALTVTWRGRVGTVFDPCVQYTLSKTTDSASGPFALPANSYDLRPEAGPADLDARHRLNVAGVIRLPHGFQSGVVLSAISGTPFDITTGFDDNGDTAANDRPHGVTRNTGRGPATVQLDVRLARSFALTSASDDTASRRRDRVDIGVDAFNLLNHTNVTSVVGVLSSPFFGRANAAAPARTIQLSARYTFRR